MTLRLLSKMILAVMVLLLLPRAVFADNCSSLGDCFGTLRAAIAATAGVGVLAALLSFGLDLLPGVGTLKGIVEAVTGRDLVMGNELAWWERALGAVPVAGAFLGTLVSSGMRMMKLADRAGDGLSEIALMRLADGTEQGVDVWKLHWSDRGNLIEDILADTMYTDWVRIGRDFGGKGETFDFQLGTQLVSVKTTMSKSYFYELKKHIDVIEEKVTGSKKTPGLNKNSRGWLSAGESWEGILDIRIPPGREDLLRKLEKLIPYGEEKGVTVTITELAAKVQPLAH